MAVPQAAIRRVRCHADEAASARAALERWLAALDLAHHGLPPTAILLVRRTRAPLRALAPEAANDPLAAVLHLAARPARDGFVPAAAGAVWFADEAELLACLARDWVAGIAAGCWWWAVALGRAPDAPAVLQRWLASARAVPAALAAVPGDWPRRWFESAGPEGRARLLQALAAAFPVGEATQRAVLAHDAPVAAGGFSPRSADPPGPAGRGPTETAGSRAPPPDAAAALLALCATLAAQPMVALEEGFAATLAPKAAARADAESELTLGPAVRQPFIADVETPPASHLDDLAEPAAELDRHATHPPGLPLAKPAFEVTVGVPPATGTSATRDPAPADPGAGKRSRAMPRERAATPALAAAAGPPDAVTVPRVRGPQPRPAVPEAPPFETPLGSNHASLFFALNAAIALGLYGDFTQPRHAGLPVSPWQFLGALGRACFGRRFAADPLAGWLGARDPAPMPARPPGEWRADPAALRSFAQVEAGWHAVVGPGGLVLRHPAGFVAAWSAEGDAPALDRLCAELNVAPQRVVVHRRRRPPRPPRDLLQLCMPMVSARLALALGMPARPACAFALALPGRVCAGAQRVDVHLSLAALPLAVRLAGLDRDPGWLPAAGCDFRFHFD